MKSVWANRPPFWRLTLFYAAYVLGCGFAQALAVVPGITVSIWPPGGVFLATLILTHRSSWPWWVLAGFLGEMTGQVLWFHSPPAAAVLIFAGNALGAAMGACLLNRACRHTLRLETLRDVVAFIVIGGGFAPLVSATVGSATLAWFGIKSQTFTQVWPLFWIGDATGVLLIAPLTLVVIQQWRSKIQLTAAQWIEAGVLAVVFLGLAVLSMSTYYLPFAYIIMPPLLWAAVRFEFKGVALALTLLALITVAITMAGDSQFVGDPAAQKEKQVMLHLFLAISAFSALIIAAISRQHHQAVQTLRQSERELRELVDAVPTMIWSVSPEGKPSYINRRLADTVGISLEELSAPDGVRSLADIHPDDRSAVEKALSQSLEAGRPFVMTYRQRRADGTYRWTEGRLDPLRDEAGNITKWYGVCVDIHEMLSSKEALQEREAKIRRLVDSDIIGIVIWDLDGTVIDANDAFLRMVQYERSDVEAGLRWFDMTPPEWQEAHALEEAAELAATGKMQAREKEYFRKDGSRVPVLIGAACFEGQSRQGVAYILDLTELKHAESALRASKQQLEQMIDAVPVNILSFDPSGRLTYASRRYLGSVGAPGAHIEDFDALAKDLAHPDDFPEMFRRAKEGFATGQPFVNRFRRRTKDGTFPWIEARSAPLRDANGEIVQWYIASIDIEDEMRAQAAVRQREQELSLLIETLPALIYCADPEGKPIYRSRQLSDFLGFGLEDKDDAGTTRLFATLDSIIHPDDLPAVKERYDHSLITGESYSMRHRLRRFDGEYRWVETRSAAMRNAEGAIVQWNGVCFDIDGEVRAQERLRLAQDNLARASQAASLSELSASIAHEVNQPLAAIVANSHACHRWLSAEPPNIERAKTTAERIIRDANSAADVVSRIRALFRRTPDARSSEDINRLIDEVSRLMADEIAGRLEIDLEPDLPPIPLDRVQVQQVFVNVIRNAVEAMEAVTDDARSLRICSSRDGDDAIRIEVSDTGPGFADAERIFEPFFTTKPQGMGMGLAICRSIIESHGGRLWTANNEPQGATVAFTLPLSGSDASLKRP